MTEPTDEQTLVAGLRRGDEDAHAYLLQYYAEPLKRFLVGLCNVDPVDAEDIAVEAMYRAVRHIDSFVDRPHAGPHSFRNWLFQIARNMWRSELRRRIPTTPVDNIEQLVGPSGDADGESPAILAVRDALANLPDHYRQTLLLHFGSSRLPLTKVADILDVPAGTARQWKQRGIKALAERLKNHPALAHLHQTSITTVGECDE